MFNVLLGLHLGYSLIKIRHCTLLSFKQEDNKIVNIKY